MVAWKPPPWLEFIILPDWDLNNHGPSLSIESWVFFQEKYICDFDEISVKFGLNLISNHFSVINDKSTYVEIMTWYCSSFLNKCLSEDNDQTNEWQTRDPFY